MATVLGDFRLDQPVAQGGMGEIWRGIDERTGRAVAVKRLKLCDAHTHRERLVREAQIIQRVEHENVVRYLGAGVDPEGRPYLALEWLEGENLAERRRRAPLSLDQVVDVARQALAGLESCHARGVVHRDIKPSNLFLTSGPAGALRVKLIDFGLAFLSDEASRMTRAGDIVGTLYYLSPEQARGSLTVDQRADLYSLGVMLYELATGRLPFWSDTPVAVLLKIVTETPPRPRQLHPELPEELEQAILRAMQRDPQRRFSTATEMLAALGADVSGSASAPPPLHLAVPAPTHECRMVQLLCVQPLAAGGEAPSVIAEAVTAAGGEVHRLLGGKIIGLFGRARTLGDEAALAVRAGLTLRGAIGAARMLAATVHIEVGDEGLRLDGRDLDRATSLLEALPAGELYIDAATRDLLGSRVEVAHVGEQLAVHALAARPMNRRVLGVETPTVGRETELGSLRAAFRRAIDTREPEAALVVGPAGMGKTRLVAELAGELRPQCALCLEGRADSSNVRTAYALLADAVTRAADIHIGQREAERRDGLRCLVARHLDGGAASEVAAFVGEAIAVPFAETAALRVARAEPQVMREKVTSAFAALLGAFAAHGPVLLCLEDLQWADDESLGLVEALLERLEGLPLLCLATARPELLARRPGLFSAVEGTRVELAALGRRSLRRLLQAILGPGVPSELEDLVGRWCEGNPYFAEELISWLVGRGAIAQREGSWRVVGDPLALQLPAGIEGAIQGRLDELAAETKELLRSAAVFGEVFWEEGCVALGHAAPTAALHELEREEFIVCHADSRVAGACEWAFRHALLHQVAYGMLPHDRRQALHLDAGSWLARVGELDAALLAHHFEEGGDLERAATCHARAGAKALADGDLDGAVARFCRSLVGIAAPSERAERLVGLARSTILLGRYDEAWETLRQLAELPTVEGDPRRRAELLLLRGRVLRARGLYLDAEAALRQAQQIFGQLDDLIGAFEAQHALFWVVWMEGRYADTGPIAETLFAEAERSGRPDHLCAARLALAYYHVVAGDLSASVRLGREAAVHAREIGHPFREVDALTLLGSTEELVGLYEQAEASLRAAAELAARLKTVHHQAGIAACLGRLCLVAERQAEALQHYRTAIERAEAIKDDRTLIVALAGQARALALPGDDRDHLRALQTAERALRLALDLAPPSEAEARLALAEVHLAAGRPADAATQAREAVAVLDRLGMQEREEVEILLVAYEALQAEGQGEAAITFLQRAQRAVEARAQRIGDATVRASFLERVPYVRRVMASRGSNRA